MFQIKSRDFEYNTESAFQNLNVSYQESRIYGASLRLIPISLKEMQLSRKGIKHCWSAIKTAVKGCFKPRAVYQNHLSEKVMRSSDLFPDSRPYVRWWWLQGPFTEEDIESQLNWIRDQGFGGVELAWLFPYWIPGANPSDNDRLAWLSPEFTRLVALTKQCAERLGLGCDFTFGSCWPFGGSFLEPADQAQTFDGPSKQTIFESWEAPIHPPILNHLSRPALNRYMNHMRNAFDPALSGRVSAAFCDSLEIGSDTVWSPELWEVFQEKLGYDLRDQEKENPQIKYDIRKIVSETILRSFYRGFTEDAHEMGAQTRVQCHGAPTDLLAAYKEADVPESESLLFNPTFSRIPASAAALAGRPVVSCESFTCIYGFNPPKATVRKEKVADMKLLADALFANGINQIVWHGMPYNPKNTPTEFFASVHVGPDSSFVSEIKAFNHYMETVSTLMRLGKNAHRLAVYLPNEDMILRGDLPAELQTPGAKEHSEMRYVVPPPETMPYQPVWISGQTLQDAKVIDGLICSGDVAVPALYIDVEWLDIEALKELLRLAENGATIIIKRVPKQPGYKPNPAYDLLLDKLYDHVVTELTKELVHPMVVGEDLPPFWCREDDGKLYIFFAHPAAAEIRYPMAYGQAEKAQREVRRVQIEHNKVIVDVELTFAPGDSIALCIDPQGEVKRLIIPSKMHNVY